MNTERNPVGWFEIYVNDMARAKTFYEAMLDVKLEELPSPDPGIEMWAFPMDQEKSGSCGALAKMEGCSAGAGGTLIYFSCVDCADDEARAAAAGGRVIKSKFPIGDYGNITILEDTEGNTIGLHSMA
ncbi:MAG: VOC family protein [Verrucomicrobiota bacterium]